MARNKIIICVLLLIVTSAVALTETPKETWHMATINKYTTTPEIKKNPIASGQVYGLLTIVSEAQRPEKYVRAFICKCQCGNEVVVRAGHLRNGHTKSCGDYSHLKKENAVRRMAEFSPWRGMKQRCLNPKNKNFHHYGGRGIKVCERWLNFKNFLADMGPRPSLKHSIERLDSSGDYEPSNCKWATSTEQLRNTRRNVVTLESAALMRRLRGSGKSIYEIGAILDVKPATVYEVTDRNISRRTWT